MQDPVLDPEQDPGLEEFSDENQEAAIPQGFEDYIGLLPEYSQDFASAVMSRAEDWKTAVDSNGLYIQAKQNFRLYFGAEADETGGSFNNRSFALTGENGEFVRMRPNVFRKWLTYVLNMATAQKTAMQAKAGNTEGDSLIAAQLFDGLLQYYMEQWKRARLSKQLHRCKELALFTPASWLLMEWDPAIGQPWVTTPAGEIVRTGDLYVKARSFWDVWFDTNIEDEDELDWLVVRDYYNKYDLAKRFKDKASDILALHPKEGWERDYAWGWDDKTDLVPVYKFYHRSTPTVPEGRVAWVCDSDLTLIDGPNPYRDDMGVAVIPVLLMRANDGLGSLFAHNPGNDVAPIQMAYSMTQSGIVTTEAAFGVPNIVADRGSDVALQNIAGGMNLVEVAEGKARPEVLDMGNNGQRSMDVAAMLSREGEGLTGLNGAVTGNPDVVTKAASGRVMGLLQSQSVAYQNGYSGNCSQLDVDAGNLLLLIMKRFANTEQVARIVGKDRVVRSQSFTGETFRDVAMVVAESVNPISRTTAGAKEEAEFMVQNGIVSTPQEYLMVRNTGQLEPLYRADQAELNLIQEENTALLKAGPPEATPVLATDRHEWHIPEHLALLASPAVRTNSAMVQAVLAHVAQHQQLAAQMGPPPGQDPNAKKGGGVQKPTPSSGNGQEQQAQGSAGEPVAVPAEANVTNAMQPS